VSNETALNAFREIPETMLWRDSALHQIDGFRQLTRGLGFPWEVVGHHTSKSIRIPVIRITCGDTKVYLRDNFHDINVCMVSKSPFTTPLSVLFDGILKPLDWTWYLSEIARCRGYSWREWTDEQMDTPGLLALSDDAPWYTAKRLDEKARWAKRMTDPEWWSKDWASGAICWEGKFGPGARLWIQVHPFLEGISKVVPASATKPYEPGCKGFAIAVGNLEQVEGLIKKMTRGRP